MKEEQRRGEKSVLVSRREGGQCNIPVFITIKGGVLKFIMQTSRRFYKNMNKPWRNFVHHDKVLECSTRIIRRQEAWIFSCHGKIQNFLELDICRELRYLQGASQIVTSVTHPRGYGCLYKEGATPCHAILLHSIPHTSKGMVEVSIGRVCQVSHHKVCVPL